MERTKIEEVLMKMQMSTGIKGFNYIADAIEIIDEKGEDISVTKILYPEIAEKRNTTPARVERAIRHALETVRGKGEKCDVIEKYIGFVNCTNFSSLMMLYKKIKQEETNLEYTDEKIREIVRQELRIALEELKQFKMEG